MGTEDAEVRNSPGDPSGSVQQTFPVSHLLPVSQSREPVTYGDK